MRTNMSSAILCKLKESDKHQKPASQILSHMNLVLLLGQHLIAMTSKEISESFSHGVWRWFSKIEVVSGVLLAEIL